MSYLWQEFNIKTFPSETLVFRNGDFCDDLSDYENCEYNKKTNTVIIKNTPKLPVHIIYIGEIDGKIALNIEIKAENAGIFMTNKIINKKPAFLNIFVKNAGKKSFFRGQIIAQNYDSLNIDATGQHLIDESDIFINTRVLAHKNTNTILKGFAKIDKNIKDCNSDISFSVMADESAKITMVPTQYINSVPKSATHSASLYKPTDNQINYLRESGLSGIEVKELLETAFLSEQ